MKEPLGQPLRASENTASNCVRIEMSPVTPEVSVPDKYLTEDFLDRWDAVVLTGRQPSDVLSEYAQKGPYLGWMITLEADAEESSLSYAALLLEGIVNPNLFLQLKAKIEQTEFTSTYDPTMRIRHDVEMIMGWAQAVRQVPDVVYKMRDRMNVQRAAEAYGKRELSRLASQLAGAYQSHTQITIEESIRLGKELPPPDECVYVFEVDIDILGIPEVAVRAKTSVPELANCIGIGKTAQAAIHMLSDNLQQVLDTKQLAIPPFPGGVVPRLSLAFSPQLQSLEQLEEIED